VTRLNQTPDAQHNTPCGGTILSVPSLNFLLPSFIIFFLFTRPLSYFYLYFIYFLLYFLVPLRPLSFPFFFLPFSSFFISIPGGLYYKNPRPLSQCDSLTASCLG
jgi:hypothetical protein